MFAAATRLLLKCLRLGRRRRFRLLRQAEQLWLYGHLCLRSLLYNSFTNGDVVLDSLFEPVYWLVDHVTRWFGVVSPPRRAGFVCCWGCGLRAACAGLGPHCGVPIGLPRQRGAGAAHSSDADPFPVGVCGTGDRADELYCGHRVHLPAAPHPADLHTCLDMLAPRLWTLEPHHDCLPLLHGHHHFTWAPSTGEAPSSSTASPSWTLGTSYRWALGAAWCCCRMPLDWGS